MTNKRHKHRVNLQEPLKRLFATREVTGGGQPGRGKDNRRIIAQGESRNKDRVYFLHATKGYRSYSE